VRPRVENDDRESRFGELRADDTPARACADDAEIHLLTREIAHPYGFAVKARSVERPGLVLLRQHQTFLAVNMP
jgi:hypothetical protein